MRRAQKPYIKARAFSLIEAAIVLGIVGLVIGGIWVAAGAVNSSRRISVITEAIVAARTKTDMKFGPIAATLSPTSLIAVDGSGGPGLSLGILPTDWISGNYAYSPFGGWVELSINVHAHPDIGTYISMTFYGSYLGPGSLAPLPQAECIQILSKLFALMKTDNSTYRRILWARGTAGVNAYSNDSNTYTTAYLGAVCNGAQSLALNWSL